MRPSAVSIKDVSRSAAVSISTVSHVLNGTRYVSPELRTRVEQAVAHFGYRQNGLARSLRTRQSYALGLVSSSAIFQEPPQVQIGAQMTFQGSRAGLAACEVPKKLYTPASLGRGTPGKADVTASNAPCKNGGTRV